MNVRGTTWNCVARGMAYNEWRRKSNLHFQFSTVTVSNDYCTFRIEKQLWQFPADQWWCRTITIFRRESKVSKLWKPIAAKSNIACKQSNTDEHFQCNLLSETRAKDAYEVWRAAHADAAFGGFEWPNKIDQLWLALIILELQAYASELRSSWIINH